MQETVRVSILSCFLLEGICELSEVTKIGNVISSFESVEKRVVMPEQRQYTDSS